MSDRGLDPLAVPELPVADPGSVPRAASADGLAGLSVAAASRRCKVALRAVREMLGMDVAYVSEIVGDNMILRELDGDGTSFRPAPERSLRREETYCQRMLDSRIPNLILDVPADDRTASLPITKGGNIGAFATVALTFPNGRVSGTLCAASHEAKAP